VSIAPLGLGSYAGDATLVPLTVQVRTPGTTTAAETRQAFLRPDGTLRFLSLQRGTFDVSVKGGAFLRKTYAGVTLTDAGVTLAGVTLVNGTSTGTTRSARRTCPWSTTR
jgi:hypothetical protein